MEKFQIVELWRLLKLTRREYGHTHELSRKLEKEIVRRLKS